MKRKTTSRVFATLCVTAMLMSSLAGCGNEEQSSNNNNQGQSQESNQEQSQESSSAGSDTGNSQDNANAEERPTLTMWSTWTCNEQVSDPGDTAFYQAIEEACNVDLEFIDSTGGKDGLSILIGTNDLPDIIYEYDGNISGGIQKALADGTIIPLNDLMDGGYMPYFKAYLESDPEVDKMCKNDDGLYAWVPMIRRPDSPLVFNGNMIRQDWLDELGLEMPETVDEMEEILLAFKEKKGCEAGYSFSYNNYSYFVYSYGIAESFYVDDGVVKYGFLQDSYKDFLTRFNKWFELGILDPDGFSQSYDTFLAKVATDQIGILRSNIGFFDETKLMKANNPEMNFVPMPFPVLNKGEDFPVDASDYRVNNVGMAISSTCQNPEAAARVLDYVYGEEGDLLANFGIEGKSFEYVDGVPTLTELVTNNPDGLGLVQALSFYAGNNNKPFLNGREMMLQSFSLDVQKDAMNIYWPTPNATIKRLPPITMTAQETEEYSQIMSDINTYVNEYKLKFILGSEPLDNFDSFRDNIRKMNIERALEIQQAAYDRFISR